MIEMIILQSHQSFYNFINWQFPFWQAHFVRLALIKKTFPFHHNQPSKAISLIFENKYSSTLSKLKSSFLFSKKKKFQSYFRNMVSKLVFKKKVQVNRAFWVETCAFCLLLPLNGLSWNAVQCMRCFQLSNTTRVDIHIHLTATK